MKDQHEKITGYRDLTQAEIDIMNRLKAIGETIREALAAVDQHIADQENHAISTADIDEQQRLETAQPVRWLEDAQTALSQGIMFAVRAVAQPTSF